jgi:hypothetical protein
VSGSLVVAKGGKNCKDCDINCNRCSGGTEFECTECKKGFFLAITDPVAQKGKCESKESILSLKQYQSENDLIRVEDMLAKPKIYYLQKLVIQNNNANLEF